MGHQENTQAVVVSQAKLKPHQGTMRLALFNVDGTPFDPENPEPPAGTLVLLTGLAEGSPEAPVAGDSVTAAVAKLQAEIEEAGTGFSDFQTGLTAAFAGLVAQTVPLTVGTAIGTAAKTTTGAEPATNTMVLLKFTNGNSAETPTVAFNGGTARAIKLGGTASAAAKLTLAANGVAQFFFDGTVLHQIGVYS